MKWVFTFFEIYFVYYLSKADNQVSFSRKNVLLYCICFLRERKKKQAVAPHYLWNAVHRKLECLVNGRLSAGELRRHRSLAPSTSRSEWALSDVASRHPHCRTWTGQTLAAPPVVTLLTMGLHPLIAKQVCMRLVVSVSWHSHLPCGFLVCFSSVFLFF